MKSSKAMILTVIEAILAIVWREKLEKKSCSDKTKKFVVTKTALASPFFKTVNVAPEFKPFKTMVSYISFITNIFHICFIIGGEMVSTSSRKNFERERKFSHAHQKTCKLYCQVFFFWAGDVYFFCASVV